MGTGYQLEKFFLGTDEYRVPVRKKILGTDGYKVPAKFSTMPTPGFLTWIWLQEGTMNVVTFLKFPKFNLIFLFHLSQIYFSLAGIFTACQHNELNFFSGSKDID